MRVLVLTPYFPPEGGGLERYALRRAVELKEEGNEVRVLCMSRRAGGSEVIEGMRLERVKARAISNTPLSLRFVLRAIKVARRWRPELIEAHTPVPFAVDVAFLISLLLNVPLRVFYHTAGLKKGDRLLDLLAFLYSPFELFILKRAEVTAVSRTVAAVLRGKGVRSRISPPSPDPFFVEASKRRGGEKGKVILFAGQLGRYHRFKNLDFLIRAFAVVAREFPEWELWVAGEGDMKDEYEELAEKLGVGERVGFLGRLDEEGMVEAYSRASLLVLPSSFESFGLAVLEGALFGAVPMVSPAVAENFRGTPLERALVVTSVDRLAEKLRELFSSPKVIRRLRSVAMRAVRTMCLKTCQSYV